MRSFQLLVGVVLLLCPAAKAETIFVGVDDYLENIVEEANDGDVLVLEAGDHVMSGWPGGYQIVVSGITLTIRGAVASDGSPASGITNGQTDTIIRCLSGANVLLENLDIHHGEAIGTADRGGALYIGSSSVTMRNCTIRSNRASDYGGGVYCTSSTLLADNCEFRSNSAWTHTWNDLGRGGAVALYGSQDVRFTNCTFHSNGAENLAGAVFAWGNSQPVFEHCVIRNSWAQNEPTQGLYIGSGSCATFYHSTICSNGDGDEDEPQFTGCLEGENNCISADCSDVGDADADGVFDCNDLCDGPDVDLDSDGIADCQDADVDGDGIDDGCDVDFAAGADCNGNGVIDSCETPHELILDPFLWMAQDEPEAEESAPSQWTPEPAEGRVSEPSNVYGPIVNDYRYGTYYEYLGAERMRNVTFEATLERSDDDYIGMAVCFLNPHNCYVVGSSIQDELTGLWRIQDGAITMLDSTDVVVQEDTSEELVVEVSGDLISVSLNGSLIIQASDSALGPGNVALYNAACTEAFWYAPELYATGVELPGDVDDDGLWDDCDPDDDNDGIADDCDPDSTGGDDCDGNGFDDTCDPDQDGDGTPDACDSDIDGDGIDNDCDVDETGGSDCDGNGVDDTCDSDQDGDGTPDGCDDDDDGDGIADDCDPDSTGGDDCDGNGFDDTCDPDQDGDGTPDACDSDIDGDGIDNDCDVDETGGSDCDGNGVDDTCDSDQDGDGTPDGCDDDIDGDGVGNDCDIDQTGGFDCNSNGLDDACEGGNVFAYDFVAPESIDDFTPYQEEDADWAGDFNWHWSDGVIRDTSNAYGWKHDSGYWPGTFLIRDSGPEDRLGSFSVEALNHDDDRFGVAFCWQDIDNYYVLSSQTQTPGMKLFRKVDGGTELMASTDTACPQSEWRVFHVDLTPETISVTLIDPSSGEETLLFSVVDTTHAGGRCGFYHSGSDDVQFRSITFENADIDGDGVSNLCDGCPEDPSDDDPGQCGCGEDETDTDGDGESDCVDDDIDGDGIDNACDVDQTGGSDCDGNGVDDACDPDQDGDGTPDACDGDIDGDGIDNTDDAFPNDPNEWADNDGDGVGDNADPDDDNDTVDDVDDNCPWDVNPDQADCDEDGAGDVCELLDGTQLDEDGNGIPDDCEGTDCPEDLDGNGAVNIDDMLLVIAAWGDCDDPAACPADLDGTGAVTIDDLLLLIAAWGLCP